MAVFEQLEEEQQQKKNLEKKVERITVEVILYNTSVVLGIVCALHCHFLNAQGG